MKHHLYDRYQHNIGVKLLPEVIPMLDYSRKETWALYSIVKSKNGELPFSVGKRNALENPETDVVQIKCPGPTIATNDRKSHA